eukprot:c11522_g1_i1 orf=100-432(+)
MVNATVNAIEFQGGNECKISRQSSWEETANTDKVFAFPLSSSRRNGNNFTHQNQFIDLDLLSPTEWEMLARPRRSHRSWDSQESELHMPCILPELFESVQVASADELFFK